MTLSSLCLLSQTSHRKSSGFSAVSQLFSERWPSTPVGRSFSGPTTERNIDFELDVRVEIDSGKCVLHPSTQQPEHEDVSFRRWRTLFLHCFIDEHKDLSSSFTT